MPRVLAVSTDKVETRCRGTAVVGRRRVHLFDPASAALVAEGVALALGLLVAVAGAVPLLDDGLRWAAATVPGSSAPTSMTGHPLAQHHRRQAGATKITPSRCS
jgi:hypothetical protein